MVKQVYLELFGLHLYVEVEYEDNVVCGVQKVYAEMPQGHLVELKCSTSDFYQSLEGELQEALERELETDKIANAEMSMDAAREEGRL